MRKCLKSFVIAVFLGLLLPGLVFSVVDKIYLETSRVNDFLETEEPTLETVEVLGLTQRIPVQKSEGSIEYINIDEYLVGVVLGEMPASFHEEALKAQAIVARTYTLKRITNGQKHPQGAVCTTSSCCQAYQSLDDFFENGGTENNLNKVIAAVNSTSDQVLYYDDVLIEATYFSCSGGRTEDALAVWGADIPYLQSVDSPGEEGAAYYTDFVQFSADEISALLGINVEGSSSEWFGETTYTEGGGVEKIEIANKVYTGIELREKLGLRSTAFTITPVGDTIYITTRGFGHRVGMSQYGADAMALNGSSYQEILSHYYPGTELGFYSNN